MLHQVPWLRGRKKAAGPAEVREGLPCQDLSYCGVKWQESAIRAPFQHLPDFLLRQAADLVNCGSTQRAKLGQIQTQLTDGGLGSGVTVHVGEYVAVAGVPEPMVASLLERRDQLLLIEPAPFQMPAMTRLSLRAFALTGTKQIVVVQLMLPKSPRTKMLYVAIVVGNRRFAIAADEPLLAHE